MNVVQVSFFVGSAAAPPEQLLVDWHSLGDIAESVAADGNRVVVVQASQVPGLIRRNSVDYHFLAPPADISLAATASFRECFTAAKAQVVHVHGLGFGRDVLALRAFAPRTSHPVAGSFGPAAAPMASPRVETRSRCGRCGELLRARAGE